MTDVLYKATKYMNVEDALQAREEKPKKGRGRRTRDKIGGERSLEPGINVMKSALDPPLEDSLISPH